MTSATRAPTSHGCASSATCRSGCAVRPTPNSRRSTTSSDPEKNATATRCITWMIGLYQTAD